MEEQDAPAGSAYDLRAHGHVPHSRAETESSLIRNALAECAATFGTERARFVRRISAGGWYVHALQNGSLITHHADQAEIAMAWMVGLSRFPIRVTKPRVTQADGSGVRPIAVASYLGIPVLCRDHLVGVIELAGNVKGDLGRTLERLSSDFATFGERLTHDPALRATQLIDLDAECWLDGGFWRTGEIDISADEWAVLSAIGERGLLSEVAASVRLPEEQLIDVTRQLVVCGIASARATTRVLADDRERYQFAASVAAGSGM